jgi:hypothetical protein
MHRADGVGIGCRKYIGHLEVDAAESEEVMEDTLAIHCGSRPQLE